MDGSEGSGATAVSGVLTDGSGYRDSVYLRVKEYRDAHAMMTAWHSRIRYLLMIPSTLITALTSCIAFVSSSDTFFDSTTKNHVNTAIGVITILATALQSYQAACAVETKIKAHHAATEAFRDLSIQLKFDTDMDLNNIDDLIVDASDKCTYDVPLWVWRRIKKRRQRVAPDDEAPKETTEGPQEEEEVQDLQELSPPQSPAGVS